MDKEAVNGEIDLTGMIDLTEVKEKEDALRDHAVAGSTRETGTISPFTPKGLLKLMESQGNDVSAVSLTEFIMDKQNSKFRWSGLKMRRLADRRRTGFGSVEEGARRLGGEPHFLLWAG